MKIALIFIFTSLLFNLHGYTMSQRFTFSELSNPYTSITGTNMAALQVDEALSTPVTLPFNFPFAQNVYNSVQISSNGWIGLGSGFTSSAFINKLRNSVNPVIAPLWDDLSMLGGSVIYTTTGSAPDRVFVVQYTNAKWIYNATSTFSFQVKLFENGSIEFCYGPQVGTPNNPSASIGINVPNAGMRDFFSITPGMIATISETEDNEAVTTFPGNGKVYHFTTRNLVPNLVYNGSCEMDLVNNAIPGWNIVQGNWTQDNAVPPYEGQKYFYAGSCSFGELYQVIDVSAYAAQIDQQQLHFHFKAFLRSWNQVPPDEIRIIVEYKSGGVGFVLYTYDTYNQASTGDWSMFEDTVLAPVGTRQVCISLFSYRNAGTGNDGYADEISLSPIEISVSLDSPVVEITKLPNDNIHLSWSPINGASFYQILSSSNPDNSFTSIGTTTDNYWEESAAPYQKRFYKVKAWNY